jgi:hypothetical protein
MVGTNLAIKDPEKNVPGSRGIRGRKKKTTNEDGEEEEAIV